MQLPNNPSDLLAASLHATPLVVRKHGWKNTILKVASIADENAEAATILELLQTVERDVAVYAKVGSLSFTALAEKKLMPYCFNRNPKNTDTIYNH